MIFQETETSELKRVLNDALPKEIDAFLNSFDGNIYIGVEDDGTVIGVENLDDVQKRIADIITTQILPNPQEYVTLGTQYVDGKNVVVVSVRKGKSLYYIKKYGRSAAGCFIRVGTSCRSMTEEQIEQRYIATLSIPEKAIKDIPVLRDDYTFNKLKQYLISHGIHIQEETFYKNFGLCTSDGKFNLLADILADENMNSIKVAVFKGKDKSVFIKRNEYGFTCLIESLEKVINYCDALNETFIDVSVRPRKEHKADASVGKSYSEIVGIKAKVDARWANAVTKIIATENKEASFRILDNAINALKGLGYDTLYAAYNVKFKEKKQTLGVPLVYPLNRSDYTKKTISEGGRYTWEKNGKTYSDVWGARGDINYYKKYIIV